MKQGIVFIVIFFITVTATLSYAQTYNEEDPDMYIKVGGIGALTLSMNTTDYHVSKVSRSLGIGSHLGVKVSIPIERSTRVLAEFSLHTLAFADQNEGVSFNDQTVNHSSPLPGKLKTEGVFQYTMFAIYFQASQFFVGFGYGIPASSELKNTADGFEIPADGFDPTPSYPAGLNPDGRRIYSDITPTNDEINPLLELRLGGEFPILKSRIGDLNLGISLAYTFNNIIKDSKTNLPNYEDQFHLPNMMFHLSYMFNL